MPSWRAGAATITVLFFPAVTAGFFGDRVATIVAMGEVIGFWFAWEHRMR